MDLINALSFVAVASLLVMSPGPNGVLIAKTVPASGKIAGFANVAGFVAAFHFHGLLSILGISAILLASQKAFFVVKMIGTAYLCWIGIKALMDCFAGISSPQTFRSIKQTRTSKITRHSLNEFDPNTARTLPAFVEGFLTNALNPKTSMFYLAAFPQFITVGEGAVVSAFILVLLHTIINVTWFGAISQI